MNSGKINLAQYNTAMQEQNRQITSLGFQAVTTSSQYVLSDPSMPYSGRQVSVQSNPNPATQINPNLPVAPSGVKAYQFEQMVQNPTMQNVVIPTFEAAATVGAAVVAPEIVIPSVLIGEAANVGVKSVAASIEKGTPTLVLPTTYKEVTEVGLESAAFSLVGAGAFKAVSQVGNVGAMIGGQEATQTAAQAVGAAGGRVAISTGLGATGGAILSGGDPQKTLEGAAFGAAFGVGSELVGAVVTKTGLGQKASDAFANVKERIVGSKATEIVGGQEVYEQYNTGKETDIMRLTQPDTRNIRIRNPEEAELYRNLTDRSFELSGTQSVKTIKPGYDLSPEEVTVYPPEARTSSGTRNVPEKMIDSPYSNKPVTVFEETRNAEPIISAVKGEEIQWGKVRVGNVKDMLKFDGPDSLPVDYAAVERVNMKTGIGGVSTTGKMPNESPSVYMEKTVVSNPDLGLPNYMVQNRDITAIQMYGKLSDDFTGKFAQNLIPKTSLPKDLTGPMKPLEGPGSPQSNIESSFQSSQATIRKGIDMAHYNEVTQSSGPMENYADWAPTFKGSQTTTQIPTTTAKGNTANMVAVPRAIVNVEPKATLTIPRGVVSAASIVGLTDTTVPANLKFNVTPKPTQTTTAFTMPKFSLPSRVDYMEQTTQEVVTSPVQETRAFRMPSVPNILYEPEPTVKTPEIINPVISTPETGQSQVRETTPIIFTPEPTKTTEPVIAIPSVKIPEVTPEFTTTPTIWETPRYTPWETTRTEPIPIIKIPQPQKQRETTTTMLEIPQQQRITTPGFDFPQTMRNPFFPALPGSQGGGGGYDPLNIRGPGYKNKKKVEYPIRSAEDVLNAFL